jgi:hypothetical protein
MFFLAYILLSLNFLFILKVLITLCDMSSENETEDIVRDFVNKKRKLSTDSEVESEEDEQDTSSEESTAENNVDKLD